MTIRERAGLDKNKDAKEMIICACIAILGFFLAWAFKDDIQHERKGH